jgi:hypothetical protein
VIAILYAILFLLAAAVGLPLGFALFGRRHAAGWIAGGLLGYAITAIALWVPIRLGLASPLTFMIAWAAASVVVRVVGGRLREPLVVLPEWRARDGAALAVVLFLTLAIAVPPFLRAGAHDKAGNRYYRAYFTADFVWHEALTAEVAKFALPPRNPYLAHRPIHYYWTYFLPPAAGASALGTGNIETILKVNAVGTSVLFVSAIFLFAWTIVPRAWPVAAAVSTAIAASSAEGAWALLRLWQRGAPLSGVKNLNIDALTAWWPPHGLRIDGLPRCFWWVPQHSMAYALGLVALTVAAAARSGASMPAIAVTGVALGGATAMNPFVGGVFSLVWGLVVTIDAVGSRDVVRRLLRCAVAAVPVVLAVAWCAANEMVEGAKGALQFGWLGEARHQPLLSLMLSLGPVIVAAVPGLFVSVPPEGGSHTAAGVPPEGGSHTSAGVPTEGGSHRRLAAPLILAAVSLLLMHFVRLDVDTSWVGFRAGQMFLVAVPALIAAALATRGARRAVAIVLVAFALLAGAPTTIIDAYNAQDITNFSESPNGPWTVTITADETEGLEFLRRVTPATAIAQMDPLARERSTWSLIPSFAQRRMAAGRPISLLGGTADGSEYADRSRRVQRMYQTPAAREASDIARALRIDFIWIDRVERSAYPSGMAKFDTAPEYFTPVFQNAEVRIYRVR